MTMITDIVTGFVVGAALGAFVVCLVANSREDALHRANYRRCRAAAEELHKLDPAGLFRSVLNGSAFPGRILIRAQTGEEIAVQVNPFTQALELVVPYSLWNDASRRLGRWKGASLNLVSTGPVYPHIP